MPDQLSFAAMWPLICIYHQKRHCHFTPEMVACIFWEESGFCNVLNKGSKAAGFGQVLPSLVKTINERYKTQYSADTILHSDDESVEVAIIALELAWEWKKDKVEALKGYAGYPNNQPAIRKWQTAEPELLKANLPTNTCQEVNQDQVIAALKLCSQPGWDPAKLF